MQTGRDDETNHGTGRCFSDGVRYINTGTAEVASNVKSKVVLVQLN
jgi:hypothetical protein